MRVWHGVKKVHRLFLLAEPSALTESGDTGLGKEDPVGNGHIYLLSVEWAVPGMRCGVTWGEGIY